MNRLFVRPLPVAVALILLALISGCTDKPTGDMPSNANNIALNAKVVSPQYLQMVDFFVLTVTATDMDPIVDTLTFDGRYVTGEIQVPSGDRRLFVLLGLQEQGFNEYFIPKVIYQGTVLASVRPNVVTPLTIELVPMVPMVRLSPVLTTVQSGSSFAVELRVYNVPNLVSLSVGIDYDYDYFVPDGATLYSGLDPSVQLSASMGGDAQYYQVDITDPDRTGLVDASGYGRLAVINIGTNAIMGDTLDKTLWFNFVQHGSDPEDSLIVYYSDSIHVQLIPVNDRPVNLVDPILESEVRYQTGVTDTSVQLMLSDVLPLTYLSVVERGVHSLEGIEDLINLQYLNLDYCNVEDFSPLSALNNLRSLEIVGNKLSDVTTLQNVRGLEYLNLSHNDVSDITPLAGLSTLQDIDLSYNYVLADIGPLANLKNVEYLSLQYNNISDISPLSRLNRLGALYMGHNPLVDIGPLQGLLLLNYIELTYCSITDILPLVINSRNGGLGQYDYVDLGGNQLNPATWRIYISELEKNGVTVNYPQ